METPASGKGDALQLMLLRSDELHSSLLSRVQGYPFRPIARAEAAFAMCSISLEHAASLRLLVASGHNTSAIGLVRLQFESLTRAMWLFYVADEMAVQKLMAPLTPGNEKVAKNLP